MDKDIKEILELEKQADSIIKEAQNKADKISQASNADSIKQKSENAKKLEIRKEEALKKTESELKKKREEILSNGESDKKKMTAKAEKNLDKAVNYIIDVLKKK